MSEEVNIIDIKGVEIKELPSILSTQFDKLEILESNVQNSINMAIEAKKKSEKAQVEIGLFQNSKKEAINLLQSAAEALAEGLTISAEAQKVSFEYQTKLTEITKYLFGLGVSNIAMNRSVVRELELKLKNASEEEISELARQELKNVIMQLKAQEDIIIKQDKLSDKVRSHQEKILIINNKLENIDEINNIQNIKITTNIKDTLENRRILENIKQRNTKYSNQIEEISRQYKELDKLISDNSKNLLKRVTEENKRILENLKERKIEYDNKIVDLDEKYKELDKLISENSKDLLKRITEEKNILNKKYLELEKQLEEEILKNEKEVESEIKSLKVRIDRIDVITSKMVWKVGVSIIAVVSLIINILQLCNII